MDEIDPVINKREQSMHTLGHLTRHRHEHITHGLLGCLASFVHDAVSNPTEVVKQRLQMLHSPYRSVWDPRAACIADLRYLLIELN
ncbi:unnamed protein product [Parnassius apollo]|uniref:Mitoferrin-1 n=1 Tax=Parnassius apollo TaxID=110799 RepID=A0A8S3Y8K4_PARAO|nr:unnamed protein product [Parnassius apollo]